MNTTKRIHGRAQRKKKGEENSTTKMTMSKNSLNEFTQKGQSNLSEWGRGEPRHSHPGPSNTREGKGSVPVGTLG